MFVLLMLGTLFISSAYTDNLITYRVPISKSVKAALGYPRDNLLNFTQLAEKNGYATETYKITTADGYIAFLFRMFKPTCELRTPPVILVHGVLQVSDVWLDAGQNSMAFLLADACHDLWFANTRGTYYSRAHKYLDPDHDAEFWNFSIDEVGYYDIPAVIDTVLYQTSARKVNYIGYSQGGGSLMITLATYPEYNEKINLNIGLAPAVQMKNCRSGVFRLLSKVVAESEVILRKIGILELLFKGSIFQEFFEFVCQMNNVVSRLYCLFALVVTDGYDPGSIPPETLRRLYAHFPAGVSVQIFVHYHQTIVKGGFPKYDYGPEINWKKYGSIEAPDFDLSKAVVPSVLFTGLNDHIVAAKDVEWLSKRLPNLVEFIVVNNTFWDHFDIAYSRYTPNLLFKRVNEYLLEYNEAYNVWQS